MSLRRVLRRIDAGVGFRTEHFAFADRERVSVGVGREAVPIIRGRRHDILLSLRGPKRTGAGFVAEFARINAR
jgi:hypothetical protein